MVGVNTEEHGGEVWTTVHYVMLYKTLSQSTPSVVSLSLREKKNGVKLWHVVLFSELLGVGINSSLSTQAVAA